MLNNNTLHIPVHQNHNRPHFEEVSKYKFRFQIHSLGFGTQRIYSVLYSDMESLKAASELTGK